MKNYEYNIVFPPNIDEGDDDLSPDEAERMIEFIHALEKEMKENPRFLIPFAPVIFKKTILACEQILKEFGGKLRAQINSPCANST